MNKRLLNSILVSTTVLVTNACGGGGGGSGGSQSGGSSGANFGCDGGCANQALTPEDVTTILQQAITATKGLNTSGTFAVLDRLGNVLALYQMSGAPTTTTINGQIGAAGGLEGQVVPSTLAVISKAGTGAYLSSQGNAFSTRTASQIIQEHYLPGQFNAPGGPLFGVQFSQFVCGDVTVKGSGMAGPRALPLGLSADPGGLPLYKNGDIVGGIGVEFDGLYTLDRNISDTDDDPEERVALAASVGFAAPAERVGDNISVGGRTLRFADISYSELTPPDALEDLDPTRLVSVPTYGGGTIRGGVTFGTGPSGIVTTTRAGVPVAIIPRFPTKGGRALPNGAQLQPSEVDAILDAAVLTASRSRAAIRTPRDTAARVSIFVVDDLGTPIGFVRSQDAPVFGVDVSLQKARAAALLSSPDAASLLSRGRGFNRDYAGAFAAFASVPLNGSYAIAGRSVGNMARPYTPDGIDGTGPGPFSLPYPGSGSPSWSVFNTGLQLDIVASAVLSAVSNPANVPASCSAASGLGNRAQNGIQIFPGSVPLYRNGTLIGAVGVSGDGIDQDDLVSFYSPSRKGLDYAGHTTVGDPVHGFNAPPEIRADHIDLLEPQLRLRYVNCPEAPFIRDNDQNACEGQ